MDINLNDTMVDDSTLVLDNPSDSASTDTHQATQPVESHASTPDSELTRQFEAAKHFAHHDEEKTRVLSGSDSKADDATRFMSTSAANESDSVVSRTLREERRSVLAMLQSATADPHSAAAAALLNEKYEVVGELGKGGVGQVLKVLDRDLKREVAMKMLLPGSLAGDASQTQDALIRFIEEAQATGQLEHPNIVPVHDLGVDHDGRIYFTLKYVQGVSLKKAMKGRNENARSEDGSGYFRDQFTAMRMIEILVNICQAVAYAHSKGIIHRDLKPDNVMLGKYGEVLVMDWGLAKVVGKKSVTSSEETGTVRVTTSRADDDSLATMEGSIAGTPAYMSPEQASGKISQLDQRTDIYALGAILYEVLAGKPPYSGAGALELVAQVVKDPPPKVTSQKGAYGFTPIPRELAAICEKAMARDPQDRYPTTSALRDDLQAYLENLPVSAAPDTTWQKLGKWIRRNRRQVQSSALSAAVVVLVILGGWFAWRTWTIQSLLTDAGSKLETGRTEYSYSGKSADNAGGDPYASQTSRAEIAQKASIFRGQIEDAQKSLIRALDIAPSHRRTRLLLAESYMDLWRLAILEQNRELAKVARVQVERYSPDPDLFAAELNGFGSVDIAFDAPDAESYLFTFLPLITKSKDGSIVPQRLIPVPYDAKLRVADSKFLASEQQRIHDGKPLPVDRHSIFNLEPTPASKVGSAGKVTLPALPPGSYMLLVKAKDRQDTRIPFFMPRLGKVTQSFSLPVSADAPAGFFYMAGGTVTVGGETAGAPAPHTIDIKPAWIYHDEISMGQYADFLKALVKSGKAGEAKQRLPKDFGKNLATLAPNGQLLPADKSVDAEAFSHSPVRGVSYNDAMAYVAWRSKEDGLPYRLPKDWEWEAACRGTDARKYSWGDTPGKRLAVVTQGYGDTGSSMSWKWEDYKDESPWGIHNLAGGAAEWTLSLYDPKAKPEDPVYGQYAIRGNAWALPPVGLECAFRTSGQPDYFHPTIGFRIALDFPVVRTGTASATGTDLNTGHQH